MKKIIYSLVIMIAAGSLFTSCVNYDEPVGVQDLREAKAAYLDALSGLRAADAAVQNAVAEINKADAAKKNAEAEYQKLVNAAKSIENEQDRAEADQAIQAAKEAMEKATLEHQTAMAAAQAQFEQLKKDIEALAMTLTPVEQKVLKDVTDAYTTAFEEYNKAVKAVEDAQKNVYDAERGFDNGLTKEQYEAKLNSTIATATKKIADANKEIERINSNEDLTSWRNYLAELQKELEQDSYNSVQLKADTAVIWRTDYFDAEQNATAALRAWLEANPQPEVEPTPVVFTENEDVVAKVQNGSIWFAKIINKYAKEVFGPYFNWSFNETFPVVCPEKATEFLEGDEDSFNEFKQLGLNGIIKVIEDSKILESDTAYVESLKAKKAVLDSTYKADLATLKKGLVEYVKADSTVINKIADTVTAYNTKLEKDSIATAKEVVRKEVYSKDTTAAKEFKASLKDLINEIVSFRHFEVFDTLYTPNWWGRGFSAPAELSVEEVFSQKGKFYTEPALDSLLKAVQNTVAARQALLGSNNKTDFVKFLTVANTPYAKPVADSIAISKLTVEDLAQTPVYFKVKQVAESDSAVITYFVKNKFTGVQKTNSYVGYKPFYYESQYTKKVLWSQVPTQYQHDGGEYPIPSQANPYYGYNYAIYNTYDAYCLKYSVPAFNFLTELEAPAAEVDLESFGSDIDVTLALCPDPVSVLLNQFGLYLGEAVGEGDDAPSEGSTITDFDGAYFWQSQFGQDIFDYVPAYVHYVNNTLVKDYVNTFGHFRFDYEGQTLVPVADERANNFGFCDLSVYNAYLTFFEPNVVTKPVYDLVNYPDGGYEANNCYFTPDDYIAAYKAKIDADADVTTAESNLETARTTLQTAKDNAANAFIGKIEKFFGNAGVYDETKAIVGEVFGETNHYADATAQVIDKKLAAYLDVFEYAIEKLEPYVDYDMDGRLTIFNENEAARKILEEIVTHYANALTEFEITFGVDELHHLVFGSNSNSRTDSEWAQCKQAEFAVNITGERLETVGYFEAVKAWAEGFAKAIADAEANNEAYDKAWDEWYTAYCGYTKAQLTKKGITSISSIYGVKENKYYVLGGALGEIYDEYFAELDEELFLIEETIDYLDERVIALQELIKVVNDKIVPALDHEYEGTFDESVKTIEDAVAKIIAAQKCIITTQTTTIANAQADLERLAAGANATELYLNTVKRTLEEKLLALAQAEEALKLAKAEYDAVVAKYIK